MRTAQEMFEGFLMELNRQGTLGAEPVEFNYHVLVGQYEYLKMRYWGFERHQKSIDDLSPVTVVTDGVAGSPLPLVNQGTALPGEEWFEMPGDVLGLDELAFVLQVRFQLRYQDAACAADGTLSKYLVARRFSHNVDDRNPYAQGNDRKLFYQQRNNVLRRINGFSQSVAEKCQLHYLRMPRPVTVDLVTGQGVSEPELGPLQNTEIVKWTVASYLEKLESQRQRTMMEIQGLTFTHQDGLPA